jgi:hypothetical protein
MLCDAHHAVRGYSEYAMKFRRMAHKKTETGVVVIKPTAALYSKPFETLLNPRYNEMRKKTNRDDCVDD